MKISIPGLIFAIASIGLAKASTALLAPFLYDLFGLTAKQEEWLFLLMVWAVGYWGYALKQWAVNEYTKSKEDKSSKLA
ncbi:hypothetical protein [Pseudoalteromonas sp. 1CM17D]|uniref:hypothetical protein n=1 Tax=Pseudoalteromonas sp. 1CM17D TaxID=2929162 RepID=UPI0020BE59D3|nr:hypothetical protein [Pseudoalteromonas sp. 1CM17D]MCK8096479.1 hypothetical protein [Pseudoalteromonas sp. 1CM17D]